MNNDLISRKALKEQFNGVPDSEDKDIALMLINNAPSVEPFEPDYVGAERLKARQRGYEQGYHEGVKTGRTLNSKIKQGEWIYHKGDGYFLPTMECSQCHESDLLGDLTPKLYKDYYKFCFRCGADMRKGGAKNEDSK